MPYEWQRAWPAHLWGAACEAHLVPAIPCKLEGLVSFKSFARPCKLQCIAKGLPVTFKTQPGIAVHKVLQVQPCGLTGLARTCKLQGGAKSFYDLEGLARPCKLQCAACTPCYLQDLLSGTVAWLVHGLMVGRVAGCKGGRVEWWKGGRLEGWKAGMVGVWKGGRMEG